MANVRAAISNVLDTVVASSNTVCNTIGMVNQVALAGNRHMAAVLEKQQVTLALDVEIHKHTIVETKAMELAQIRKQITAWASADSATTELYNTALEQLQTAVNTKLGIKP